MVVNRLPQTAALVNQKMKIMLDSGRCFNLEFADRNKVIGQSDDGRGTDWREVAARCGHGGRGCSPTRLKLERQQEMISIQRNLAIFNKLKLERPPVGVKFLPNKPDGVKRLDKILDFCEMLKEAQEASPFYAAKEDFTCVGPLILGMVEHEPIFESGLVGPRLEIFKEARANRRIYRFVPKLAKGTVNYIAFSPLDKLSFDPDVLIVTADPSQAEIILRANSYATGNMWSAKGTPVAACAWLYIYPYLSGELNFTMPAFSFGMRSRRLFPEGVLLISIPWDLLPSIAGNLKEMKWVPHSFTIGRQEHKKKVKRIVEALTQETAA